MELHKLPKRIQRFVMIIGDLMITSAKPIGITGKEVLLGDKVLVSLVQVESECQERFSKTEKRSSLKNLSDVL